MKKNSVIYKEIDPARIRVMNGFNQRVDFGDIDELAEQIKEQGLLEAVSVIPVIGKDGAEEYLLINGERRYRALMKLKDEGEDIGLVKANILPAMSDDDLYVQQFMRNEGKKFNDVELGMVCRKLLDMKDDEGNPRFTRTDVAKMLGKNPGVITYALQSLDYDPRITEMIKNGEIGGTEVRRIYTAARKKYGTKTDEWQRKADEEILRMRAKANEDNEGDSPAKVSIKENDLYGDVKDTKTFFAGMKVLIQYASHYQRKTGLDVEIDIFDMYKRLRDDEKLTLRELFEEAVKQAQNVSEAL